MTRHDRVIKRRPAERPHPVFSSPSGRRSRIVAIGLSLLVSGIWLAGQAVLASTQAAPRQAPYHGGLPDPRLLSQRLAACSAAGRPVPVIGYGVLQRILAVQTENGAAYGIDPFSGQVVRPLTALEQHAVRDCSYVIDRFGEVPPRTIALTYDDGPDGRWTPQLLAILRAYRVRATFFTVGENVLRYPAVFRELIAAGQVVGNHTLDHQTFDHQSDAGARQELVTTDHLIASLGNYRTRLFRLPYGGSDPDSLRRNVRGLLTAQQLGFTNVGFNDDTDDFRAGQTALPAPVLNGQGEVVVMHDGGGNRLQTLSLTVRIIQQAQARGYRFITMDQLVPAVVNSRAEVTLADRLAHRLFWAHHTGLDAVTHVALTGSLWAGCGMSAFIVLLAVVSSRRRPRWERMGEPHYPQRVSVLIAAYNEAPVIEHTVRSVLATQRPFGVRLIVVDDGSTDETPAVLARLAATVSGRDELIVLAKANEGSKGPALNHALFARNAAGELYIQGPIAMTIDADTRLHPEAIRELVRPLACDPAVGVVGGYIRPLNRGRAPSWRELRRVWSEPQRKLGERFAGIGRLLAERLLIQWQRLDYDLGMATARQAQAALNAIPIAPGALMAFRPEVVRAMGGFPLDTLAEDADVVMQHHWQGWQVVQNLRAIAYTEVPATLRSLFKQRKRWNIGVLQVFYKHSRMMRHPGRFGPLAWAVLPLQLAGVAIPLLFLPINYLLSVRAIFTGQGQMVLTYLALFTACQVMMAAAAMVVLRVWSPNLVTALVYRLVNDPLQIALLWYIVRGVTTGKLPGWGKLKRIGEDGGMTAPVREATFV